MPIDPRSYFISVPQTGGPMDVYRDYMSLRDLMDRRRYNDLLMRKYQMQEEKDAREEAERQAFRNVLSAANPTDQELIKASPELAWKYITSRATGQKEQRAAEKAATEAVESDTERRRKLNQQMADIGMEAVKIKDPAQREEFFNTQLAGTLIDRGFTPAQEFGGFRVPANQREAQFAYGSAYGADKLRAYMAAVEKDAQEQALYPFKTRQQIAETATAEGKATGTEPITTYQKAQLEQNRWGSTEGLISVLSDPKASDADKERALAGLNKHMELRKAGATSTIISPNQTIANEAKLRDDYIRDTKTFPIVRDSWNKIRSASESQTGPGDISLIYGYMRMMDPGSTVREGEFATAQNAGNIPERIRAMYNKAISGERLDANVRKEFVNEARKIYTQAEADYGKTRDIYGGIAERGGMDRRNVVIDLSPATPSKPAAGAPKVGDILPNGKRITKVTEIK